VASKEPKMAGTGGGIFGKGYSAVQRIMGSAVSSLTGVSDSGGLK